MTWVKSDISEYSHSLGCPTPADAVSPCLFCFSDFDGFFNTEHLSPHGAGFPAKTLEHYDRACGNCEFVIEITEDRQRLIAQNLVFSKSKVGSHGRVLKTDLVVLGLLKNDRLEPSSGLRDVFAFEEQPVPFRAVFWRKSKETHAKHRNPMLSIATGIEPNSIGIDWMHTISLGVAQFVLSFFFWALIDKNVYGIQGGAAEVQEMTITRLREDLDTWYENEHHRGRDHCKVQNLMLSLLGTASKPAFKYHAAETNGVLHFAVEVATGFADKLGASARHWTQALACLQRIVNLIHDHKCVFPLPKQQEFCEQVCMHLAACKRLALRLRPKHHMLIEMAGRYCTSLRFLLCLSLLSSFRFCCCCALLGLV